MQSILKGEKIILEFDINEIDGDVISLLESIIISKKISVKKAEIEKLSEEIQETWRQKTRKEFFK